jgi:hypothetical protein
MEMLMMTMMIQQTGPMARVVKSSSLFNLWRIPLYWKTTRWI